MCCFGIAFVASAQAEDVLAEIKQRDFLKCGVDDQLYGFAYLDGNGVWKGFEVDLCRALAAAVLGHPDKVEFVSLNAKTRFSSLKEKQVDILLRSVTWTFTRDNVYGLDFPAIVYYDHLAILAPKSLGLTSLDQVREGTFCVADSTTTHDRLRDYIRHKGLDVKIRLFHTREGLNNFFFAGQCEFYAADYSALVTILKTISPAPENYVFLKADLSKEPLSPAVRHGDILWGHLVKWLIHALIAAEEKGITRDNLETLSQSPDTTLRFMLGIEPGIGKPFDLSDQWVYNALKAVGNYGEIFSRNLGEESGMGMDRGLNRLWKEGGLLYSIPFR